MTRHMRGFGGSHRWWGSGVVCLAMATGCGSQVVDGSRGDEEATTTGPGEGGPQGAASFDLVEMSPAPESRDATPNSVIRLTFSLDVDPATVDGIQVFERESKRWVETTVEVEGNVVTLTPTYRLRGGTRYTVRFAAVRGLTPDMGAAEGTGRFFIGLNLMRQWVWFDETGAVDRALTYGWDPATREHREDELTAGPDGVFFTADDGVSHRLAQFYDELLDPTTGEEALPDETGVLVTEHTWSSVYDARGLATVTTTSSEWGYSWTDTYSHDDQDRLVSVAGEEYCIWMYRHAPEGRYTFGALENVEVPCDPSTPPPLNGAPYRLEQRSPEGRVLSSERFLPAGPTADPTVDELLSYEEWSYHASGTTLVRYSAPGMDGVWHTEDDVASGRTEWRRDAEGWWDTRESFGPGADGILGTADDRLSSRAEYQVID